MSERGPGTDPTLSELLPTPFVSSWVGAARRGNASHLTSADSADRIAAWAQWALESITAMSGFSDRQYPALVLPGRFYDPRGTGPAVRPHLEIPARTLTSPAPDFPTRLAMIGNGLLFPWWVPSEVTAARRSLFNTPHTSADDAFQVLTAHREGLSSALTALMGRASGRWDRIERLLISADDGLSGETTSGFLESEVAEFFPAAKILHLTVTYDPRLREKNGVWASRRVGVWQVQGINAAGDRFAFGVLTPRLTANSLFSDPLFAPSGESAGALLVRGLLLRRLYNTHLGTSAVAVRGTNPVDAGPDAFLRAIPAKPGSKLPEASLEAATRFLQAFSDPDDAWAMLAGWAEATQSALTVNRGGFTASFRRAKRFLRRAEELDRDDVNVILPLCWSAKGQVVRVTLVRYSS